MPSIEELIEILVPAEPKTYGGADGADYLSVTSVVDLAGFGPDFSKVPKETMDYAKERGRIVHKACEFVDKGILDYATVDPAIRGYVDAYIRFRNECHVRPIAVEKTFISATWEIGGTPDLVCFLNGKRAVVDRKTGVPDSVGARLQTAGYVTIYWDVTKSLITDRYGLKLSKDGSYKLVPHESSHDEQCFMDLTEYLVHKNRRDKWVAHYFLQGEKNNGNHAVDPTT